MAQKESGGFLLKTVAVTTILASLSTAALGFIGVYTFWRPTVYQTGAEDGSAAAIERLLQRLYQSEIVVPGALREVQEGNIEAAISSIVAVVAPAVPHVVNNVPFVLEEFAVVDLPSGEPFSFERNRDRRDVSVRWPPLAG